MKVALIAPRLRVEDAYRRTSEHLFRESGANTGNFAFVHALWSLLSPNVEIFPWHASPEEIRSRTDLVVMACANQLGPHTDLAKLAETLERTGLPILAIGLGAQARNYDAQVELTAGTRRWLEVVAAHAPSDAPNIGVRGEFSRRQVELAGYGERAIVTGCPSNFINPDPGLGAVLKRRLRTGRIDRLGATAGMHHWVSLAPMEQMLAMLVERTGGLYVTQSEIDMIRLARGEFDQIERETLERIRTYVRPSLSIDAFKIWCKRHATCFTDATSWMEAMRTVDFVVGPRIHGVMLAIQAGTPGGVIAHDSRTHELCETMAIPVRRHEEIVGALTLESLPDLFPFDAEAYRRRRIELGETLVALLGSAGVDAPASLRDLLASETEVALEAA